MGCGAIDPVSGAVCTVEIKHEAHKDESPDFVFTWVEIVPLIVVNDWDDSDP